jgi:hypothetical protein
VQTLGGNIIQGQVNKIRVGEIYLPYDVPSIVQYSNDLMTVYVYTVDGATGTGSVADLTNILVTPGFYTATELKTAISAQLTSAGALYANLVCEVDPVTNAIYFRNVGTWTAVGNNYLYALLPISGTRSLSSSVNINDWEVPTLVWSLGLKSLYSRIGIVRQWPDDLLSSAPLPVLVPVSYPNVAPNPVFQAGSFFQAIVGTPYNGAYTPYIDICSPSLCQAQYVRDGNTNQNTIRRDLIARVYVASEVSTTTADPPGARPFIIHRQFKNAKIMKWTAERSIDTIDLNLYDQYGQPLPDATPIAQVGTVPAGYVPIAATGYSGSRDYAITFLVDEHDEGLEHNVGYRA